jgi:S1-C subfamily serine protease
VRPVVIAAVALVAAFLGALAAVAIGAGTGWGTRSTTVVTDAGATTVVSTPAAVRVPAQPLGGGGFDPAEIYAKRSPGVVTIYSAFAASAGAGELAQGSGFVVSPEGYVLTNSHVITNAGEGQTTQRAARVYVEFADGDRVVARIVGWDVFDDVGLIKVDPAEHPLSPVPLGDSASVVVGEPVAAIGSPFGNENSLATGVVSAVHRSIESLTSQYNLPDAIQTDAPINHGNSGGPLFDAAGRVIGINAQIRSDSGNGEGVGFAVPIDAAERSMRQLIRGGRVRYSFVGISTEDVTPAIARHFGYPVTRGAAIVEVGTDSPGAHAGLRGATNHEFFRGQDVSSGGDVIVAIQGRPVRASDDVIRIASEELSPGQVATFTVLRDGKRRNVRVVLGERPAKPSS